MPEPGAHGILQFRTLDVADLSQKLAFALTNDLSDNAAAGHQFILREYSPQAVAGKAEAIYQEAVFPASKLPQV